MAEISIIVPVYNVKNYLRDCVDSILSQDFQDFEVILVDDGSSDGCEKICDSYAKTDERIKVIHKKNGGLSGARNAGFEASVGEYVCFVDSDDCLSKSYCSLLHENLKNTECDYCVCSVMRFADGAKIQNPNIDFYKVKTLTNKELLGFQLNKKSEFGVWNKLYRKSSIVNIPFATGRLNEDVIFSADLAKHCNRGVVMLDAPLYFYRQRNSGIVASQKAKPSLDMLYAKEYLLNYAKESYKEILPECLSYSISYSWSFIDGIIVRREFSQNKEYIDSLRSMIKKFYSDYKQTTAIDKITKSRILLFARSKQLYYLNAYLRLLRLYLFKIIKKDPYKSGHGI